MGIPANKDFTLAKYEKLCLAAANSKYTNLTFEEYFSQADNNTDCFIILRHDIDENARYALDVARVEHSLNLKATYYFRMKRKTYVSAIMDEIAALNHEIGYHYETIDKCGGDTGKALDLFENELSVFRQRYSVKTACMHGNPISKHDNKAIWQKRKPLDFGLLGEPYLSLDYSKFAYFSDSGRTWDQNTRNKVKDRINARQNISPRNTDELIEVIKNGEPQGICVLTHPERWSKNLSDYSKRYLIDMAYWAGKAVIHQVRKR
ncbi:hypothetical protein ACFLVJ_01250 [Chloroflexota bacterium]